MKKHNKTSLIYSGIGDKTFDAVVYLISAIIIVITFYPILFVVSASFSGRLAIDRGQVWLYPINVTFTNYKLFFTSSQIIQPYLNTIFYTTAGTAYSLLLTLLGAYALSKNGLIGKNIFIFVIMFTMLFGGGLIPTFLVVSHLGMYNTIWAMLIPCAVAPMNLIIVRTAFMQVPDSLSESAVIDGANDLYIFARIIVPLSKPVIATMALFYAVGRWNDYFTALIYLNSDKLFPIQLVMRSLLVTMNDSFTQSLDHLQNKMSNYTPLGFKSAVIVITMLPVMVIYPFIQKYFVKGVMIGAIKG